MEQTANNAIATAKRLLTLFQEDERRIQSAGRRASTTLRVFRVLCERPLTSLTQVCERTGLSFPAAARAMEALVALGIAREVTSRRRNRIFAYERYMNILNEGTEVL